MGLLVLCAALILSAGRTARTSLGAKARATSNDSSGTLSFGGRERTYLVHLPASYDAGKRWPLVFALHGGSGTGPGMDRLTHLNAISDRHSFIAVYPDGYRRSWADGRGTTVAERAGVDDVGFIAKLLDKLSAEFSIDPARVYATGISNGGFMSERLACELSGRVAAVAALAATIGEELAGRCQPSRAVPVMLIHGTEDPLVPWGGGDMTAGAGGRILSVQATVKKWAGLDGCAGAPTVTKLPGDAAARTRVRREVYSRCKDDAEVILYAIEGGGHTWPGGLQYLPQRLIGKTNRDMDSGEVIWEFFNRHPMR